MKEFTRSNCQTISAEAMKALEAVATKHGLSLGKQSGRFTPDSFTFKVEFAVVSEGGVPQTKAVVDFGRFAEMEGVTSNIGDVIVVNGKALTLTGYNRRASKMPFLGKCVMTGQRYKLRASQVIAAEARA